jgi:predicted transcriptional regulator
MNDLRRIKAQLVYRGIRQVDIAKALGVTPTLICSVLAGRRRSPKVLSYIRELLNKKAA